MSTAQESTFAIVPLAAIVSSPTNPRKSFDADKLNELASTIKASGVHTPILLRYLPPARLQETFADRKRGAKLPEYEIVAGERRYRASVIAGAATIPALIRAMSDAQALEVQMIENLQRDDLSELEEAEGYQQLCDLTHISKEALGDKIGRSRRYVYDRLRLLKLQPLARASLRDGKISATAALAIATVHDGDLQAKALAHATSTNHTGDQPSTRALQTWMRQNVMLELAKAPFDIKLHTLNVYAGACAVCPKRTGADPDIFAESQGPDMCCDAPCYHNKAEASRKLAHEKFKAQGIKIIDGDEAEELHMYGETRFEGYSPLSQTREDTADGKPATLLDLLGKKGQAAVGLVAIEHPHSKNVQAYVDTKKAEAWLLEQGLVVEANAETSNSKKAGKADSLKELLRMHKQAQLEAQYDAANKAIDQIIVNAPDDAVESLLTTDLISALVISNSSSSEPFKTRAEGVRGLLHFMCAVLKLGTWLDEEFVSRTIAAYNSLASQVGVDLAAVQASATSKSLEDYTQQIAALQAKAKAKTAASKSPFTQTPLAQPTGGAGGKAKPKLKKAKLTPEQAQLGIAVAMQKNEEVAAKAAVFEVGQLVKVVKLDGRNSFNAGTRVFEPAELEPQ